MPRLQQRELPWRWGWDIPLCVLFLRIHNQLSTQPTNCRLPMVPSKLIGKKKLDLLREILEELHAKTRAD